MGSHSKKAKFAVSLHAKHPSQAPEKLIQELGLKPYAQWKAGDNRKTPKGQPLSGVHEGSFCGFAFGKTGSLDPEEVIGRITEALGAHSKYLNRFRSTGGSIAFYLAIFSREDYGLAFGVEVLSRLIHLGISLGIEYFPGNVEGPLSRVSPLNYLQDR